jgi:hypothetical protein
MYCAYVKRRGYTKKKSLWKTRGKYIDGLVSTGNKFPNAILYIISLIQKIFPNYFINILKLPVDNG